MIPEGKMDVQEEMKSIKNVSYLTPYKITFFLHSLKTHMTGLNKITNYLVIL